MRRQKFILLSFLSFLVIGVLLIFSINTHEKKSKKSPPGHWSASTRIPPISESQQNLLSSLSSLSYLQGYRTAPPETGITVYDRKRASAGVNLYVSGHAPEAFLIDMEGNLLHSWRYKTENIWPIKPAGKRGTFWMAAHVFENGDLLALIYQVGVIKIDKNSRLLWAYPCFAHHVISVDERGNIYTMTSSKRRPDGRLSILDDAITILNPAGRLIKSVSLFDMFNKFNDKTYVNRIEDMARGKIPVDYIDVLKERPGDVFHANTLQIFDGKTDRLPSLFKKGRALVCMRHLGLLAVVDLEEEKIVRIWEPKLWHIGAHDATLLGNGNILLFDNYYTPTQSRVIEFDPVGQKILWQYAASPNEFFSEGHGTSQRLPNGNTLITESYNGRAFEVAPKGEIVWEFFNPHRAGEKNELIATLFRVTRLDGNILPAWTDKDKTNSDKQEK